MSAARLPAGPWRLLVAGALLLAVTGLRLMVAAALPLSPDEAYYWVWSRALAAGYPDHPPMVALWIAAGTRLLGEGALGVRLLSPLAAAAGSVLLARATADLFPGQRLGVWAAAMLNATLLLGVGAVTMTPDTPLLLFWTATLAALARLAATGNGRWWLAAGFAAGLALDSKYTAALLGPAILAWLVGVPSLRRWLRRWQPWAGAGLAVLAAAPVLVWNVAHGWVSFARQGGRVGDWRPARAAQFLGELLAGQMGLATPLLAVLFGTGVVVAVRRGWRGDPAWALLAVLSVLPAAVFVQHALGDRVQANWVCVCYPAAAVAACASRSRWRLPAVALGGALTALVWVQGVAAPIPLPRRLDPTLMRLGGWPGLAAQVEAEAVRTHAGYVAVEDYGLAAILARLLPPSVPVVAVDSRWAFFRLPSARGVLDGPTGLLVRSARHGDAPGAAWIVGGVAGEAERSRDGRVAERYRLYRVRAAIGSTAATILPRP